MRALVTVLALFSVATSAGCRRDCLRTCEQRAKELGCLRAYECKQECEDLKKQVTCRAELDKFAACFLGQPKERWHCDDGKAVPKPDTCSPERGAIEACMQNPPQAP